MVITAIEDYPKGKGKVAVYLNSEFAFCLYKGELTKFKLKEGMELSEEIYARLLEEVFNKRATKRAMNLIKTIDRTESDIRNKLSDGGYPAESVDYAVDYLKSFHYIDDYRYAQEYYRFKSKSFSRKVIVSKLMAKGISLAVINSAIEQYEEENGIDSADANLELITKLIKKKYPDGVADISYEGKQKLFAYLYNKGFNISDIDKSFSMFERGDIQCCKVYFFRDTLLILCDIFT